MLSKGCGEAPERPPTFPKGRNPRRGIHYFGDGSVGAWRISTAGNLAKLGNASGASCLNHSIVYEIHYGMITEKSSR